MLTPEVKAILEKQGYRIVGRHSAVKVCHWTRERLLRKRSCYKSRFYGIASHRCLQMTPSVAWCQHACLFCWRPVEHTLSAEMQGEGDDPDFIVEEAIKAQRALLSGYGGEKERVTRQEIEEAYSPKHVAISLAGEPTNYPRIAELVEAFHRRGMTTFLVTNGMNPERIAEVRPTSLYLSLIAYNEELYRRINVPRVKQGWERLMHSLEVFSQSRSRKVVRITLVRGYNLETPEAFAPLIERAEPDFVEAKGYVHVGYSRRRLTREHMPSYEEVGAFAKALAEATGYVVADSSRDSKVFLIKKG